MFHISFISTLHLTDQNWKAINTYFFIIVAIFSAIRKFLSLEWNFYGASSTIKSLNFSVSPSTHFPCTNPSRIRKGINLNRICVIVFALRKNIESATKDNPFIMLLFFLQNCCTLANRQTTWQFKHLLVPRIKLYSNSWNPHSFLSNFIPEYCIRLSRF